MTRSVTLALTMAGLVAGAAAARAADGAKVFAATCQACHQPGGVGAPGLAPPLVSPVIKNAATHAKDYPTLVVTKGLTGMLALTDGSSITGAMPPQATLADADVAAVVAYVFHLNHATVAVTAADVARAKADAKTNDDLKHMRQDLLK